MTMLESLPLEILFIILRLLTLKQQQELRSVSRKIQEAVDAFQRSRKFLDLVLSEEQVSCFTNTVSSLFFPLLSLLM